MASLFHRSRQRRAERAPLTASGNLNLVPLIDVLTSIVFFGLLSYTGVRALATLTAFDLALPPAVESRGTPSGARVDAPLLTLRVDRTGVWMMRAGESA